MVNVELLKETLEIIEKNPQNYDQSNWVRKDSNNVCGTAMCFAGHAAVLAGAEVPDPKKHNINDWYIMEDENKSYLNYMQYDALYGDANAISVRTFATEALGIRWEEADYLFDGDRSLDEIRYAVNELVETGELDVPERGASYCCYDCDGY